MSTRNGPRRRKARFRGGRDWPLAALPSVVLALLLSIGVPVHYPLSVPHPGHFVPALRPLLEGGGSWTNATAKASGGLDARTGMAFSSDTTANVALMFGGKDARGAVQNDTWITDDTAVRNISYSLKLTPPALAGASETFDPADGYFLLFGGQTGSGTLNNASWGFSIGTTAWGRLLTTGPPPPAQVGGAMAYDTTDGYVLFQSSSGAWPTWTFHGGVWTDLQVPGPSARSGASLAFDPASATVILFGGRTPQGLVNETWSFSAGAWHLLSPRVAPPAQAFGVATYLPANGWLVAFGGSTSSDTWGFDGTIWQKLATGGPGTPVTRNNASFIYDEDGGSFLLLFGGTPVSGGLPFTDFWAWDLPPGALADPTATPASLPPWVLWSALVAAGGPILGALLFYRPRKKEPASVPVPTRSPTTA